MQASRNGLLFIAQREALVLVPYPDPTWVSPSDGFGHNDPTLKPATVLTIPQAFDQLKADASVRAIIVNKWLKAPATQPQFDALLSCYYEYGSGAKAVVDAHNAGEPLAIGQAMLSCCKQSGSVVLGLLYRRFEEGVLYFMGNYGNIGTVQLRRTANGPFEIYTVQDSDLVV